MDEIKIRRYFEINEQLKNLQKERDALNEEIKKFMVQSNLTKAQVGSYLVELKVQDRSTYTNELVTYLKEMGMSDLIVETYNDKLLKEKIKLGQLDSSALEPYKEERLIYYLFVSKASLL